MKDIAPKPIHGYEGMRHFITASLKRAQKEFDLQSQERNALIDQLHELDESLSNKLRMMTEMTAWLDANP